MLKWAVSVILLLAVCGFAAFLYFIPPLTSAAPDEFIKQTASSAPAVDGIADPAERLIAERGRYLVLTADCGGCHTTQGPQGPRPDMFLAGGMRFTTNTYGAPIASNLTPDRETGLGGRSDEEIKMALRSGMFHTGRSISPRAMPWPGFSNWTDEDLHAVITYLRHIKPVRHAIPDPGPGRADALVPGATEVVSTVDAGK
jgi:mono/diheme cytochrome c family protein